MLAMFVFSLLAMLAPPQPTIAEVLVSFEREILTAQFLPCLHKKPLYSTMSNCSLASLLSLGFNRKAHKLAAINVQMKHYMDVHSYLVIFARNDADFKLSEQSDQVILSTRALRHRTLIGWMDCRANSSVGMNNLKNGHCTPPLIAAATSEVIVFLNSENMLNRFNMSTFVNDPLDILIQLLEANFYFYDINYESIYAEQHYNSLHVPRPTQNDTEEKTMLLYIMWQSENVFLYNFLQVIFALGPQQVHNVILNDPHNFQISKSFGRQHWERYSANPRGNEILIYKSSNCKNDDFLVDKCEPFQIIRVEPKNHSMGLLLLLLSSFLLPKNHTHHSKSTVPIFDLTQLHSLSTDKTLRNLRQGLRYASSLTILVEDDAEQPSEHNSASPREVFHKLAKFRNHTTSFNVMYKPLLLVTRRQLAWLETARFAMDLPKRAASKQRTQLLIIFPRDDFNQFYPSERLLTMEESLAFVEDAHFVYDAHREMQNHEAKRKRILSSSSSCNNSSGPGEVDRYTMEVGDVAVRVVNKLRSTKGLIPQAKLVLNLTRETYNDTLQRAASPPLLILYHVTWDSLSKSARFVLAQVARNMHNMALKFNFHRAQPPFIAAQVDCFDYNDVCAREHILQYPTLKLVQLGGAQRDVYVGDLSVRDLMRLLVGQSTEPWWPNEGHRVNSRMQFDTLLELSEMLADEVFLLSGQGESVEQAAHYLTTVGDSAQPKPLLLHVASSVILTAILPSLHLEAKDLPIEKPLLISFSRKIQPHVIVHVLEKSTCPPESSCALFRQSAMLQRFFPFNWRYSQIAIHSNRALLILVRSAAIQSLQSSRSSEQSVTRLMLQLKAGNPRLLTSWLDFNNEETKNVLWKLCIKQLPSLVLRKSGKIYVWPIPKHLNSSKLLATTKDWLHRVNSGLEDASALHLNSLDERPDPRRLAFNFVDKLYPEHMDSNDINKSVDLNHMGAEKRLDLEVHSIGMSNAKHDEL